MKKAAFLTVVLLISACAYGQGGGNAAITGTVTDPSDAVVPGATVIVTQEGTGVTRSAVANASGQFSVPSLLPSDYTVSVEAAGFKKSVQRFTLLADQIRELNVQLELGRSAQTISVEASSVLVNTVTPVLSQVIEQTRVVSIPLETRNAADLAKLVPGTTDANGHGVQQGNTKQNPFTTESIAVNGARPDQIGYNLDGANNEDLMSNTNIGAPLLGVVADEVVRLAGQLIKRGHLRRLIRAHELHLEDVRSANYGPAINGRQTIRN